MATDFFDRQDHARRQTTRLLVMFGLSVVVIILATYLALAMAAVHYDQGRAKLLADPTLWQPALFVWVTLGTLLVISVGSLYKVSELSAGGEQIALMLGGRPIDPQTRDLAERRLLNVVEEMALASGVPVPPVYVLEDESGINAFAAGHQPGDAVVAVSSGCLEYLTREELQGVMAHEFSHILNGDMRLNIRLIGIVYGILVLAVVGYYIMRFAGHLPSRDEKKAGAAAGAFLLGLVLLVLGYLGVFLGKLIKSAISRQREFLADASAVQFTRLPSGIAGALKKIGGLSEGSRIRDGHAEEISHMFFGDAFAGSFFNLFATHPPLDERIRALEPEFDGHFPEVAPVAIAPEGDKKPPAVKRPVPFPFPLGFPGVTAGLSGSAEGTVGRADRGTRPLGIETPQVPRVGTQRPEQLGDADRLLAAMPPPLLDAAREPFVAQALIYAMLLTRVEGESRTGQLEFLRRQIDDAVYRHTLQLAASLQTLPADALLPLVELTIPALKKFSPQQYGRFRQAVEELVRADGTIDLFEYCLRMVLFSYLDVHFGRKKPPAIRYRNTMAIVRPATIVLSMLAYIGQEQPEEMERAFRAGAEHLSIKAEILPRQQCTLQSFDAALAELSQSSPTVKRDAITAVSACIAADGQMTREEGELLRAIAAVLGCPMPPLSVTFRVT